jgi:hypothetical protein
MMKNEEGGMKEEVPSLQQQQHFKCLTSRCSSYLFHPPPLPIDLTGM